MLEIKFQGKDKRTWLEKIIDTFLRDGSIDLSSDSLINPMGNDASSVANFLFYEGRNAVAHAKKGFVNPDDIK